MFCKPLDAEEELDISNPFYESSKTSVNSSQHLDKNTLTSDRDSIVHNQHTISNGNPFVLTPGSQVDGVDGVSWSSSVASKSKGVSCYCSCKMKF